MMDAKRKKEPRRILAADDRPRRYPSAVERLYRHGGASSRREEERVAPQQMARSTAMPQFSLQKLTLDSAVAPLMEKPTTPFARTERKRALVAASYYSECFLNGITPVDADTAALDAQCRYHKWWVEPTRKHCLERQQDPTKKRQKLDSRPLCMSDTESTSTGGVEEVVVTSEDESTIASHSQRRIQEHLEPVQVREINLRTQFDRTEISAAKNAVVEELRSNGGDTSTSRFLSSLDLLHAFYASQGWDARWTAGDSSPCSSDGTWFNLSKPTFADSLGLNQVGEPLYTLGRLAFDMFRPTNLRCSVQGVFNTVGLPSDDDTRRPQSCPSRLLRERMKNPSVPAIRNNDIVVSLTVEANQTRRGKAADETNDKEYYVRRPLCGILTNHGYCVPDPHVPNRLSVWFAGGSLEVRDENDLSEWKHLFDENLAPRRDLGELARVLAAKCLLGANLPDEMADDGSLSYTLKRPIGGHGEVYLDVLYCDEMMRIVKGHRGSIYASIRSL